MSDKTIPLTKAADYSAERSAARASMDARNDRASMILIEEGKGENAHIQMEIKSGQVNKVAAVAGKNYRVVNAKKYLDKDDEALQDQVVAVRRGQDLQLSYPDGAIVELTEFFDAKEGAVEESSESASYGGLASVTLPGDGEGAITLSANSGEGTVSIGQNTSFLYAHGDQSILLEIARGNEALSHAITEGASPSVASEVPHSGAALALLGGIGAVVGGGVAIASSHHQGAGSSTPAAPQTSISGDVVLGPAVETNGLKVLAFKADGTLLASALADGAGHYALSYDASYTGAVLLKVVDANALPDYIDEATGQAVSLNSNIYAVVVPTAKSTATVNITPLTSLAAKMIGINVTSLNSETGEGITGDYSATNVASVNNAVAKQYAGATGSQQITELAVVTTITTGGAARTGNAYGESLAQISSLEHSTNKTTAEVLDALKTGGSHLTLAALALSMASKGLVSEASTAKSTDGFLNAEESISTVFTVTLDPSWSAGQVVELRLNNQSFGTAKIIALSADDIVAGHVDFAVTALDLGLSDGPKALTAVIKDGGMVGVASLPLSFVLDTTALAPELALATDSGFSQSDHITNSHTFTVTGLEAGGSTASGYNHLEYQLDGTSGVWVAQTGATIDLSGATDGTHTLYVREVDSAGNTSGITSEVFTLDTTVAGPTINTITSGISKEIHVSVLATEVVADIANGVSGFDHLEYQIDGVGDWVAVDVGATSFIPVAADGAHTLAVREIDRAGNTSAVSAPASFVLDTTALAPELALATDSGFSQSDHITNSHTFTVTGLEAGGSTASGYNHLEYQLDGTSGVWVAQTGATIDLSGATDGTHTLYVREVDSAGNTSGITSEVFTLDTTVAGPHINLPSDGITNNHTIVVDNIEAGSTWEYTADGGATWHAGTGTSFVLSDATYAAGAVGIHQTDAAGNTSAATFNTSTLVIDTQAPEALTLAFNDAGISSSDGITNNHTIVVDNIEAGSTWEYTADGGATWHAGTGTSFVLSDATYAAGAVGIHQTDAAGNTSAATFNTSTLVIDTQVQTPATPMLHSDTGVSGDGVTSVGQVDIGTLEAGASWFYSLDHGVSWDIGTGASLLLSDDGVYSVMIQQLDIAGNVSSSSEELTFTLNTAAPSIQNESGGVLTQSGTAISSLDVQSDIVLDFGSAIGLNAGAHITLENTGGVGFQGESTASNIDMYLGGDNKTYSDSGHTMANGTYSLSADGKRITLNPSSDLDLANDYRVTISADSVTTLDSGVSNLDSSFTFSTVAPSSASSGQEAFFMGSQDSRYWVSLPNTAPNTPFDASAHGFVYVLKDVSTIDGQSAPAAALDTQVFKFRGFSDGDFIYLDSQAGKGPQISFSGDSFAEDLSTGVGAVTMPGIETDSNTGYLNLWFVDKTTLNALALVNSGAVIAG